MIACRQEFFERFGVVSVIFFLESFSLGQPILYRGGVGGPFSCKQPFSNKEARFPWGPPGGQGRSGVGMKGHVKMPQSGIG